MCTTPASELRSMMACRPSSAARRTSSSGCEARSKGETGGDAQFDIGALSQAQSSFRDVAVQGAEARDVVQSDPAANPRQQRVRDQPDRFRQGRPTARGARLGQGHAGAQARRLGLGVQAMQALGVVLAQDQRHRPVSRANPGFPLAGEPGKPHRDATPPRSSGHATPRLFLICSLQAPAASESSPCPKRHAHNARASAPRSSPCPAASCADPSCRPPARPVAAAPLAQIQAMGGLDQHERQAAIPQAPVRRRPRYRFSASSRQSATAPERSAGPDPAARRWRRSTGARPQHRGALARCTAMALDQRKSGRSRPGDLLHRPARSGNRSESKVRVGGIGAGFRSWSVPFRTGSLRRIAGCRLSPAASGNALSPAPSAASGCPARPRHERWHSAAPTAPPAPVHRRRAAGPTAGNPR